MNDLKFAFRQLLKNPGFTAVTVLALALGIGANTAVFSVVSNVLLWPLPFQECKQVVTVWERNPQRAMTQTPFPGRHSEPWSVAASLGR